MRAAVAFLALGALVGCEGVEPLRPGPSGPPPSPFVCDEVAVGETPLRRLTREQYQHTVEDVFEVETDVGAMLSPDERAGAFATNLSTSVDRASLDAYLDAAETVAREADMASLDDCDLLTEDAIACAGRFVRRFGRLLYRRPLDLQEENRILGIYAEYGATDHHRGLRIALSTMLVSPFFLYHDDYTVAGAADGALEPLSAHGVAERMAFFLWNAGPDEALLDAAEDGRLDRPEGIREEASRMLLDRRARRGVAAFHRAWLGLEELPATTRDAELYPDFDEALARAMVQETEGFAEHVVLEGDGNLATLLTATWSIVPAELHAHYGLPSGTPVDRPVELPAQQRAGMFTHASFLTAQAHQQVSSLTRRGKLIREEVFCEDLPEPPDAADLTVPAPAPGATTRERFEEHRANETCATCHERIDPIGFAYESFDAVGRWRDLDQGLPVDTEGDLLGTDVDRTVDGPVQMAAALAESVQVERCVVRQWFRFALGRRETDADNCSLAQAEAAMEAPDNLRQLILSIVTSESFRHRPAGE